MPRRPRVEMVGYYHILNRGVEQRVVYKTPEDFEMFLEILCNACTLYRVTLHAYALMNNHYHLLIETTQENLSKYMKHVNASYVIYFNRKYKRSGHLWQGRFKSWYVTDESYLYTLIRYIENNPIKAKIVKDLGIYRYSSYRAFVETDPILTCMKESFVFKTFQDKNERELFLQSAMDEKLLSEMKKASNLVVTSVKEKVLTPQKLQKMFAKTDTNADRNKTILKAYNEGYSQHTIATSLGLSQPYINRIIKKEKEKKT